jgi:phosphatidylglycerophosphatase A
VVIDEVSGQHLALLVGGALPTLTHVAHNSPGLTLAMLGANAPLGWKYLLLGFILFRLFDIWKPFPARQAESLPGGWGIMADDWIAGLYAAIGLWLARSAGL